MTITRQREKKCKNHADWCILYYCPTERTEFYHDECRFHTSFLHEDEEVYDINTTYGQLYIDEKYNIWLPGYGNMLIELEPLPKSLYILFLRHPEGILLKNISSYRSEIEAIYRKVSKRQNPTVINRLIEEITNPASNMIHKNLSIIRAAFGKKLPSGEAEMYMPIHNRGERQYVPLDCSMIKMPENQQ